MPTPLDPAGPSFLLLHLTLSSHPALIQLAPAHLQHTVQDIAASSLYSAKIELIDTDIDWSIIELWEMSARFSPSALLTGWYLILLLHLTLLRWEANNPPHSIPPDVLLCLRAPRVLSGVVMKCQVSELVICYPQLKCSTLHVALLHVAACRHITGILSYCMK